MESARQSSSGGDAAAVVTRSNGMVGIVGARNYFDFLWTTVE